MTITIHADDITINCGDGPSVSAPTALRREELSKLTCATVLPEEISSFAWLDRQMACAKGILPAGKSITHLGVPVSSEARGNAITGESRLAVYSVTGGLIAETGNDNKLFTGTGWRFSPLATPLTAESEDRVIWLTALVPTYDVRQPALAVTSPVFAFPNLYNVNGTRTFTHPDLTQLPTDVGGDYPPLNMVVCVVGTDLSTDQQ
ncbi:hypothetical protein [Nonomuraea wenchangensis]|uniref:hypothetical protein n=1 Tax=Nonomuraea wenchangensis TaxID=568860 RepID=UPI00332C16A6